MGAGALDRPEACDSDRSLERGGASLWAVGVGIARTPRENHVPIFLRITDAQTL